MHDPTFRLGAKHFIPDVAVAGFLAFHGEVKRGAAFVVATATIARLFKRLDDHTRFFFGLFAFGDFLAHVGDHGCQRPVEFFQTFMGCGGDDIHVEAEFFEFRFDEFGQFLGFRHIDLVEDDDAGAFGDRNRTQWQFQLVCIFGQLVFERLVVAHRITVRFQRGTVDYVGDDFGAFDVAQEFKAEAFALRGSRNQAWHVGDGVTHVSCHDHAKIRHECGERVVGDFRLGGAHGCDQAGFACGREAHQCHVGDGFEFEDDIAFLTWLAKQCEARGSTCAVGQCGVAKTTIAACGHDELVSGVAKIGELFARMLGLALRPFGFENHGAHGNGQNQIGAFGTVFGVAQAHGAASSLTVGHETVVEQAVGVLVGHEDHGTTVTAIAAVRACQRLVFFSTDAGGTVAAVAALHMDGHAIDEITHVSTLIVCSKRSDLLSVRKSACMFCMQRYVTFGTDWRKTILSDHQNKEKPRPQRARLYLISVDCAYFRRRSRRRPCGHDERRTSRCRP